MENEQPIERKEMSDQERLATLRGFVLGVAALKPDLTEKCLLMLHMTGMDITGYKDWLGKKPATSEEG